ncbi:MAG: M23 family metallopeptidase [Oscillospiraceae bacterium]|nr:M23 family metallopeptidase [Oscillospiraceae bacterium]
MREIVISPDTALPASLPADDAADISTEASDAEGETVATASQVYTMAPMPENASLEQRNLGFDHCTPVAGRLSSTFGWREHPVEGGNRFHYGVDLAAAEGADILAFASGEIYASGFSSSLGNYIMLQHEGGYITLYAHCSRITATGGSVSMGEKIAEVGSTGLVTGPHLHFELHDGELYLNPIYYVAVE